MQCSERKPAGRTIMERVMIHPAATTFTNREYRIEKYGVALRIKRSRIDHWVGLANIKERQRIYGVVQKWLARSLSRSDSSAVCAPVAKANISDWWRETPALYGWVRAVRGVDESHVQTVAWWLGTESSASVLKIPVTDPSFSPWFDLDTSEYPRA